MSEAAEVRTSPCKAWSSVLVVAAGTALFDLLFWERAPGLNVPVFNLSIGVFLVLRYGWKELSLPARWSISGMALSSVMVFVHDSVIAIIAAFVLLGLAAALANEHRLRSLFFAAMQALAGFLSVPVHAISRVDRLAPRNGAPRKGWRWVKLGVVPMMLILLFTQLYRVGNPRFEELTAGFMDSFFRFIGELFDGLFTARALFMVFAAVLCGGLLFRVAPDTIVRFEERLKDALARVRVRRPNWMVPLAMDALERERRMGMILLVAVNLLLAVVNVIDVNWVWFGFEVPQGFSLKQFVHEGTWILVISIFLSMLIVMHLFRRNQNFYWRSNGLKTLAIVWVGQNFILGVSVFLRNYHYITFHGLAYKRIGVIVFLALVLVGLITLLLKIRSGKSLFYLARVNGWAVVAVLVGLSLMDWDRLIVRYNLAHWNQGEVDVDNYLQMSDRVLPFLYADIGVVEAQMEKHRRNEVRWVKNLDIGDFKLALDARRDRFRHRYEQAAWQESNLADRRTARALARLNIAAGQRSLTGPGMSRSPLGRQRLIDHGPRLR